MAADDAAFALAPDGSARDPAAFQAALRADAAKAAALAADPELAAVLLGDDVAAMQALLREAYAAELERASRAVARAAERTMDAQRASAQRPRDVVQLYTALAESGLQYGPAFRLLRSVNVPDVDP
ncbi:hypothetical protein HT031_000189 [Scenedesmus sp. PABB004]|nr:hypothetical protein HT031_000189 [Scenedesmus sp. PABB004]